ncbi:MAG: Asp23/Gls24 family envelope stress response protein [Clostridiales bacterium]|nr:Asp23/Gls24 family envelope stress response protein [Clostridiales bacterium]
MTTETKTDLGRIVVTEDLIATIAGYAAVENYGIVGMCAQSAGDSFVELFGRDNLKKGVKITPTDMNEVDVDLYVTLQYGVSLPAVAANVKDNVKYRLEEMVGVAVRNVNIHVESIRVQ